MSAESERLSDEVLDALIRYGQESSGAVGASIVKAGLELREHRAQTKRNADAWIAVETARRSRGIPSSQDCESAFLDDENAESLSRLDKIRRHLGACPVGYYQGKLIISRSAVDAEAAVIEWLEKLKNLTEG